MTAACCYRKMVPKNNRWYSYWFLKFFFNILLFLNSILIFDYCVWKSIFYFNVLNAKCQSWFLAGLNQLIWSVEGSIQSVGSFMLAWFTWIACWRFKEVNLCFWKFCWKRIFYFNVSNYYVMCKKTSRSAVLSVSKTWGEKAESFSTWKFTTGSFLNGFKISDVGVLFFLH